MALNGAFITDHHRSCLSHCILGSNDQALLSPSFLIHKCTLQGYRLSYAIGLCVKIPSKCFTWGAALAALGSPSGAREAGYELWSSKWAGTSHLAGQCCSWWSAEGA